jgi:hypothetical protein
MPTKAFSHFTGADVEFGTFTFDMASVAAAAQGAQTVTVTGAKVGDLIFVNTEAAVATGVLAGAKVTATDTVTLYLNALRDTTTAFDAGSLTYSYLLVHMS